MNHELSKVVTLLAALLLAAIVFTPITARKTPAENELASILPQEPVLNAHAYLIKIMGGEKPLAKRREWKRLAPASLTKLLTAVVATELIPAANSIYFSEEAKKAEQKSSTASVGERFLRDDIIRFALIESANDAALALAETVGRDSFVAALNEEAKAIGLLNSSFQNPAGLDQENHLSTAEDLSLLAEYIWQSNPELWEMTRTMEETIYSIDGKEHKIINTNELLKEFPAILGGKTGFTDNAKGALLFLYPARPDKTAIVVLLGSENRFGDGRKIIKWLESLGYGR